MLVFSVAVGAMPSLDNFCSSSFLGNYFLISWADVAADELPWPPPSLDSCCSNSSLGNYFVIPLKAVAAATATATAVVAAGELSWPLPPQHHHKRHGN